MSKHTPGPWKVDKYIDSGKPSLSVSANGSEVAQASSWAGDGADEAGANARLIAAAPELLEACREAKEVLDDLPCGAAEALKKIDAAISKAEGNAE